MTVLSPYNRAMTEREKAYGELIRTAGHRGTLGTYLELDGDIAVIFSGGGASLVAFDALIAAGGKPANYVEMSGNPDPESVRLASKIVLSKPGIKALWIAGSFANFTDIEATISAMLNAVDEQAPNIPIVIRRDGPNAQAAQEEAARWSITHGQIIRFDRADVDFDTSARSVIEVSRRV